MNRSKRAIIDALKKQGPGSVAVLCEHVDYREGTVKHAVADLVKSRHIHIIDWLPVPTGGRPAAVYSFGLGLNMPMPVGRKPANWKPTPKDIGHPLVAKIKQLGEDYNPFASLMVQVME